MAPGDLDPKLLSGKWRLSLADYFMPRRKVPAPKPVADKSPESSERKCCAPGCCA